MGPCFFRCHHHLGIPWLFELSGKMLWNEIIWLKREDCWWFGRKEPSGWNRRLNPSDGPPSTLTRYISFGKHRRFLAFCQRRIKDFKDFGLRLKLVKYYSDIWDSRKWKYNISYWKYQFKSGWQELRKRRLTKSLDSDENFKPYLVKTR